MLPLTRESIITAAIALADDEGLDAVTLRKLGERLGVSAMAPYRHVRDKDDLLDAMSEELYGQLELPDPARDWWDGLAGMGRTVRSLLLAHPWAVPLFGRPLSGPNGEALDAAMRDAFLRAGFSPAEARELHDQLSNMVFALVIPELRGTPNRAAFERGLELLHAGLEARRTS